METDGVAFGAALARTDLLVGLAAVVAVAAAAAIVAEGGAVAEPTALTAVLVANIATLAVAGLLWRNSRPASRIGTLLLARGVARRRQLSRRLAQPRRSRRRRPGRMGGGDRCGVAGPGVPARAPEGSAAWAVLSLALATARVRLAAVAAHLAARLPVVVRGRPVRRSLPGEPPSASSTPREPRRRSCDVAVGAPGARGGRSSRVHGRSTSCGRTAHTGARSRFSTPRWFPS